eukprot:Colp12_sorted_trinity150504_noHs@12362
MKTVKSKSKLLPKPPAKDAVKRAASKQNVASSHNLLDDAKAEAGEENLDEYLKPKTLIKPENQLQLTEEELGKEFTRILSANNPNAPQNIARYSFKERTY